MSYIILMIVCIFIMLSVSKEVVGDIRNPYKGPQNEENCFWSVSKVKTRKMFSYFER